MRRIAVSAFVVLLAGPIAGNAQPPVSPTFRAGTTLVEFTVVAVDERGAPVTDLRKDEIAVFEEDASRELAFFQFEGASGSLDVLPAPRPLPEGTLTNRTEYAPGAPRHLVAVVLDFVNASLEQQFELRAQFLHYLKQIPADAQVGLYVIRDNAIAVHDFTQDAGALRTRLEKGELDVYARALAGTSDMRKLLAAARPEQAASLAALAQADMRAVQDFNLPIIRERRRKTLAALDSVGSHMAGLPGRKSLVWVTHGFPLTSIQEASYVDDVRSASQRLASQDVAVYPVDAAGLTAERGSSVARGRVEGTSELVASITGGRAMRNNNDLTLGITAAAEDVRGTYSLGFYALGEPDGRWHRLVVKASRAGVTLRHRQGYLAASTPEHQPSAWSEEQWNDLAYRPLISTAMRINARPALAPESLKLALDLSTRDLQFRQTDRGLTAEVDIALVERTTAGPTNVRVQSASVHMAPGPEPIVVTLNPEFTLSPQTASARVIVRDKATGRLGSVDVPVSARAGYVAK